MKAFKAIAIILLCAACFLFGIAYTIYNQETWLAEDVVIIRLLGHEFVYDYWIECYDDYADYSFNQELTSISWANDL